jgi:hypothetical protein
MLAKLIVMTLIFGAVNFGTAATPEGEYVCVSGTFLEVQSEYVTFFFVGDFRIASFVLNQKK